jgi:hypothetical protein
MRYLVSMYVEIDDEALEEHVSSGRAETVPPYTTEVAEWDGSDFFRANGEDILDEQEVVLVSVQAAPEQEGEGA